MTWRLRRFDESVTTRLQVGCPLREVHRDHVRDALESLQPWQAARSGDSRSGTSGAAYASANLTTYGAGFCTIFRAVRSKLRDFFAMRERARA